MNDVFDVSLFFCILVVWFFMGFIVVVYLDSGEKMIKNGF